MPEYLAPGVYVEETSFRAKSIEGVSTSTTGFVGAARFGPIVGIPELVTSFAEFERIFGGIDQLQFESEDDPDHNYLAHGVRAFFDNGGARLYLSRIYQVPDAPTTPAAMGTLPVGLTAADVFGRAWAEIDSTTGTDRLLLLARYPGRGGNMRLGFTFHVSGNVLGTEPDLIDPDGAGHPVLKGIGSNELVWVADVLSTADQESTGTLYWTQKYFDDSANRYRWRLHPEGDDGLAASFAGRVEVADLIPGVDVVARITASVEALFLNDNGRVVRRDAWESLTFHPAHRNSIASVFAPDLPSRALQLSVPFVLYPAIASGTVTGPAIARMLLDSLPLPPLSLPAPLSSAVRKTDGKTSLFTLQGGSDGLRPEPGVFRGVAEPPDRKEGLEALADIPDISIIAAPGHTVAAPGGDPKAARDRALTIMGHLISHCERMRYSIAVLDPMPGQALSEVRGLRAQVDSTYAALYYPFVRVLDPVTDREIALPPSGFVTGIYARNDVENGVHKAPANEVVRGALGFEFGINKGQQDVLNPEGINCLRFFEGRGNRVWGARTATSDPEWKYVNVRRFFLYLERSIDRGTQWAVFENNGDALWANVRRTIEDFLYNEWNSGHLLGTKPEQAYFVRCDRSTMTQNDLDNGRLVCLIGVAPLKPAEFVIFRIGQWTADRPA